MKRILRFAIRALPLLLVAAACSPTSTAMPVAPSATGDVIKGGVAPLAGQPSAAPAATTVQDAAPPAVNPAPVALLVKSPEDGAVVNTPRVAVSGLASPGAVVSVNDEIVLVGAGGTFEAGVTLDEGPNLIEVIASNDAGSESIVDLTVAYEP